MEFHPITEMFPKLPDREFAKLVDDIRANGLIEAIWTHEDRIIDGRNRFLACRAVGVEPRFREWDGQGSLLTLVVSLNLARRHLTSSQLAMISADLEEELSEEIATQKAEKNRLLALQREAVKRGETPPEGGEQVTPNLEESGRDAAREAAALTGVSPSYTREAKRLRREDPDLSELVRCGKVKLHAAMRERRRQETQKLAAVTSAPTGRYRTIVIDPPWDAKDVGGTNMMGRGDPPYATMRLEDIAALPVSDLAEEGDCHLYLWVTNRSLPLAFPLLEAWGFQYRTLLTWCKPSFGLGQYFRNATEHVLFALRGARLLARADVPTWFEAARQGPHSTKPQEFYDLVESCSPGPRLEMFARKPRPGWTVWGAEAPQGSEAVQ